jgi:hypothetical protein
VPERLTSPHPAAALNLALLSLLALFCWWVFHAQEVFGPRVHRTIFHHHATGRGAVAGGMYAKVQLGHRLLEDEPFTDPFGQRWYDSAGQVLNWSKYYRHGGSTCHNCRKGLEDWR